MQAPLKLELRANEGNLAQPLTLSLRLQTGAAPAPPEEAAPAPAGPGEASGLQMVDDFEMALENAWQEEHPAASPMDLAEDPAGQAAECAPSTLLDLPLPPECTGLPSPEELPTQEAESPQGQEDLPDPSPPGPPPPPAPQSSTPTAGPSGPPDPPAPPQPAPSSLDRLLAAPPLPGSPEPEHDEQSAPYVCEYRDDSEAESEDEEELDDELYERFDRVWPVDRSQLQEISEEYAQEVLAVFEKLETPQEPFAPYEPYEIHPKEFDLKLPEHPRVPTPPPPPAVEEEKEEPPRVVSYRKRPNLPLLVQDERAAIARRQASERRAHGKCYEEFLLETQGVKPLFLSPRE